ncbi:hypothetical protein PHMEG_00021168 [Phytophthora megakarya]|uniref:Uncharacterized protein n=1 Tax=Phytophthora megakarya TaxID=4795 RepID=A0A225VNF9_9STRA|nr:hypothetical protein PHMEG_00021168 [Phytophthora megakarya]
MIVYNFFTDKTIHAAVRSYIPVYVRYLQEEYENKHMQQFDGQGWTLVSTTPGIPPTEQWERFLFRSRKMTFHTIGFVWFYKSGKKSLQLDPATVTLLQEDDRMRTYSPVFQQVGSQDNDAYRSQSRIQRMNKALKKYRTQLKKTQEFAMKITCHQEPHQDYIQTVRDDVNSRYPGTIPASVLVSLEPGTRIRIYPSYFEYARSDKNLLLDIPPGYTYLTTDFIATVLYRFGKGMNWAPNMVSNTLSVRNFCDHTENTSQKIKQQRFYCRSNPEGGRDVLLVVRTK